MSEIERERSEDIVRNNDGDGSDRRDDHRKKKQREHGFGGSFRKAKRVALFQFRKAEKQLHRKNKKGSNQSSSIPGCFGLPVTRCHLAKSWNIEMLGEGPNIKKCNAS
ncbi:unnamed protein product [Camellia sinensis]